MKKLVTVRTSSSCDSLAIQKLTKYRDQAFDLVMAAVTVSN